MIGKEKCKDALRDREQGEDDVPTKLYHVTLDKDSVCKTGLLPPSQAPVCGLGTGCQTKDLVSFTDDLEIARNIVHDLRTKVLISRGEITPENVCMKLDEIDTIPGMKMRPCEVWEHELRPDKFVGGAQQERGEYWEMLKQGYVEKESPGNKDLSISEWKRLYPDLKVPAYFLEKGHGSARRVFAKGNNEEVQQSLFDLWRNYYLTPRQYDAKGRPNPVFAEDKNLARVAKHDPSKVGIVEVTASVPNRRAQSMISQSDAENQGWDVHGDEFNKEIRLSRDRFNDLKVVE